MDGDDTNPPASPESRPQTAHRVLRRVPGSFNEDDGISPTKENFDDVSVPQPPSKPDTQSKPALSSENIPFLHPPIESSFAEGPSALDGKHSDSFTEQVVREHLQDVESSFAIPLSPIPTIVPNGVDDTFVFDSPTKNRPVQPAQSSPRHKPSAPMPTPPADVAPGNLQTLSPVKEEDDHDSTQNSHTTSSLSLEAFSSPTTAAAARTISRALSQASSEKNDLGYDSGTTGESPPKFDRSVDDSLLRSDYTSGGSLRHQSSDISLRKLSVDAGGTPGHALKGGKRPKYLRSRNASQRSSVSSFNTNDDVDSDVTVGLGADYALQSGGAVPSLPLSRSTSNILSRSISIGSMASGIDDFHDSSGGGLGQLGTLDEDDDRMGYRRTSGRDDDVLRTPKAKGSLAAPTDTVIARHVRNVQVPESLAREYRTKGGLVTPRKPSEFSIASTHTRQKEEKKGMTLKEQSSTIERLSKENFDLKLKVMFLSDRLGRLSEEGVKEMISENVELKTGLAVLQRDNKVLRRRVKELEKQMKDDNERPGTAHSGASSNGQTNDSFEQDAQEREEELIFLRERVDEYFTEIERLRNENMSKEAEKRRMADVVKSLQNLSEKNVGDTLARQDDETDVWKSLHEQEEARRIQVDEENRRLREELSRLKQELTGGNPGAGLHHTTNIYNITKKPRTSSPTRPVSGMSGETDQMNGSLSAATTLVEELRRESEQLRHENAELRREVGAQTSMLTSRNREKERLYQEIEDLKIQQRRGGPAPSTIDSILERSASRAGVHERSQSRASGGTRAATTIEDPEREEMENKMSEMRDKINEMKLQNQDLQRELDSCMQDFEQAIEGKKQAEQTVLDLENELEGAMNDLMQIQAERDEALQDQAALEQEFNALRKEAQEELDALDETVEQKDAEIQRLQLELNDRSENFDALQDEMRKMSEALIRLEDEQENKLRRIRQLEQDLGDANKELEDLEAKLLESNDKGQRLSVQQESSQNEIAFLREEQEGDKIRIGDLEAALANAEQVIREEKERARELDQRLATERRQREIVAGREKEEVQQVVNQLNREASAAKDESRKLRKNLSKQEVEAAEWKERLLELESNLREALGDLNGTRSSFLRDIAKLQHDLDNTVRELDSTRAALMEKDRIIKQRDGLLESHGLESRKIAETLDKERQAHRNTKNQFEAFQKTHNHVNRNMSNAETRILELETAKTQDKKRIATLEATFKEQLNERNSLLLVLWTRLSSLCGTDWAHDNSLINGRALPSLEAVATMLPGFSKNLLAAVKTIESIVGTFQGRVKGVEKELWKEYQNLEGNLDSRIKKLDRLEAIVRSGVAAGTIGGGPALQEAQSRLARLEDAYRQLKVENATLRTASEVRARAAYAATGDPTAIIGEGVGGGSPSPSIPTGPRDRTRDRSQRRPGTRRENSRTSTMTRTQTERTLSAGELALAGDLMNEEGAGYGIDNTKWMHRLKDLELKLKAEREGRALDRNEANRRINTLEQITDQARMREAKEERRRQLERGG
ncbi:putative anucleate primary sterigmata protein b protein [Phaeoacremonium minimum UCRPA7]|uniref:Putative anucleate primary sterigmata protein b protein n=1 Tax=Phaeoacremonium minimum (strain UCR-PA7) TaxID=1286976 RepID=R8BPK0_PHAM7|nr:putative anucleate primary sterigmata protein b protein [Phaeoacremonium minimum UCRPA7]EOO01264.1 putative anucleate primary sterigmata protein b protein [Phaeoacremonium minimum UCRPA7]